MIHKLSKPLHPQTNRRIERASLVLLVAAMMVMIVMNSDEHDDIEERFCSVHPAEPICEGD